MTNHVGARALVVHPRHAETLGRFRADLESVRDVVALDDLADYQRPREYAFVDDFPRNAVGKLDRAALGDGE